jgi:transposase
MNDSIKKMLRLIEKDLMITEVSYETFQKKKTLIVDAVFSHLLPIPVEIVVLLW